MPYIATPSAEAAIGAAMTAITRGERLTRLEAGPGLGKSTLLAELARRLRQPRRRVVLVSSLPDEEATRAAILRGLGIARTGSSTWADLARAARLAGAQGVSVAILIDDVNRAGDHRLADHLAAVGAVAPGSWSVVAALRPDSRGTEDEEPDDAADRLVVRVEPLTRDEAAFFAPARLSDEGRDPSRFSASALTTLHARSEGVPRRLLRLAREVLDAADREGRAAIGPAEVAALDRDRIAWLGV